MMTSPRVVISLTTVPSRVRFLDGVVAALLGQTYKADAIYINLPRRCHRTAAAYPSPSLFVQKHTIVLACDDFGPVTKLLPVLDVELAPDTIIVTVDDDFLMKPDWLTTVLRFAVRFPASTICCSGHIVSNGLMWNQMVHGASLTRPVAVDIILGSHGVAYRRRFFPMQSLDFLQLFRDATPLLKFEDDIWISGYLDTVHVPRMVIPLTPALMPSVTRAAFIDGLTFKTSKLRSFGQSISYFRQKHNAFHSPDYSFTTSLAAKILVVVLALLILVAGIAGFILVLRRRKPKTPQVKTTTGTLSLTIQEPPTSISTP